MEAATAASAPPPKIKSAGGARGTNMSKALMSKEIHVICTVHVK